jgi:hypothetical protein
MFMSRQRKKHKEKDSEIENKRGTTEKEGFLRVKRVEQTRTGI